MIARQPQIDTSSALQRDTWIVVAAFNEQRSLPAILAALCAKYAHVVLIDDQSHDDTWEIAGQFPVWRLRHAVNCGQGAALQTGIDFALQQGAEWIVTFDADGQHRADEIAGLLEPLRNAEADVALGSRFLGTTHRLPKSRWLVLKLGVLATRLLSHVQVTDAHNGLRAFSRAAASRIRIRQNRMAHASEIIDEIRRARLRYTEVPVTVHYTPETMRNGQSSLGAVRIMVDFLLGRMIG